MGFQEPREYADIRGDGKYEGLEARVLISPVPLRERMAFFQHLRSDDDAEVMGALSSFADEFLDSWNVDGRDGKRLPATGEGFLATSSPTMNYIIAEWATALNQPVPLVTSEHSDSGGTPASTNETARRSKAPRTGQRSSR